MIEITKVLISWLEGRLAKTLNFNLLDHNDSSDRL
jgi:hypothetical protein